MTLNDIEIAFREATSMYEQGEISKEEYTNLLEGFEVERAVTMNAEELHYKEQLHAAISAAISVAKIVV
jgi:hypothetical protein